MDSTCRPENRTLTASVHSKNGDFGAISVTEHDGESGALHIR